MNTYVISDIHGHFESFYNIISKIKLNKSDKLILLGDYINRGKQSKQVVDFIIDLEQKGYKITALKGNHEDMIFDSIKMENWTAGESESLASFGINHWKELAPKYLNWFAKLKPFTEKKDYIFVHAGLNFNYNNPLEDTQSMLWIKDWYKSINFKWLGKRKIIHGHTPLSQDIILKMLQNFNTQKVLCLDNGVFINQAEYGKLCCLKLNKMEVFFCH